MEHRLFALPAFAAALLAVSGVLSHATADTVRVKSESIVRYFEQERPDGDEKSGIPGYEYLQVDAGQLGVDGVTAHFYGWGRYDFGDYYDDSTQGEFLYGYLQYRTTAGNFSARLGRQYLFDGVTHASIDGLRVGSDLTPFFSWSAYGGQPVALETVEGRSGDRAWGGMLSHHWGGYYNVGVSYKRVDNDGDKQEEQIGIDSALTALGPVAFYGRSVRNQVLKVWQEHNYEGRLTISSFLLRPFYQRVDYDAFFSTGVDSSKPFTDPLGGLPALQEGGEVVTMAGGEATWEGSPLFDVGIKYKHFDYKVREDNANYYAALATLRGKGLTQAGVEAGRMDGDIPEDRYSLGRAYAYYDQAPYFLAADFVYAKYGVEIFGDLGDDRSIFASLGGGVRLMKDSLKLKLSGDYSKDPNFKKDFRGLLALEYTLSK